jgi:hypothetical protein
VAENSLEKVRVTDNEKSDDNRVPGDCEKLPDFSQTSETGNSSELTLSSEKSKSSDSKTLRDLENREDFNIKVETERPLESAANPER